MAQMDNGVENQRSFLVQVIPAPDTSDCIILFVYLFIVHVASTWLIDGLSGEREREIERREKERGRGREIEREKIGRERERVKE